MSSTDSDWDKDTTDSEDERKKETEKAKLAPKPKKKSLKDKIKEREDREANETRLRNLTPEQRKAEMAREVEAQELAIANDLIKTKIDEAGSVNLNLFVPKTKHDFLRYREELAARFKECQSSAFYSEFTVDMIRELIKPLTLEESRSIETVLKVQINDLSKKQRDKQQGKKKKGGKAKQSLNSGAGKGGIDTTRMDDFQDDYEDMY